MEHLINTVTWMLAVYGTALIISMSAIFNPVRNWVKYSIFQRDPVDGGITAVERKFKFPGKLITCIMCMGFWSGIFWGITFYDPSNTVVSNLFLHTLFDGVLGTAATWIIHIILAPNSVGK